MQIFPEMRTVQLYSAKEPHRNNYFPSSQVRSKLLFKNLTPSLCKSNKITKTRQTAELPPDRSLNTESFPVKFYLHLEEQFTGRA